MNAFIEYVKHIGSKKNTGESSDSVLPDQEIFCLKKLIVKAKFEIASNDESF